MGEWREPACGALEVRDQDQETSSGLFLVERGKHHAGRSVYINKEKILYIFWLNDLEGWGLGESAMESGETLYSSGPGVKGEPWLGSWKKPDVKIFCAEENLFTRSRVSTIISQDDKTCSSSESCLVREDCPAVEKLYQKLGRSKNDPVRLKAINDLKSNVCNKKEKGFCCPEKTEATDVCKSCKLAKECLEVKKKIVLVRSGTLPFSESIKIYRDLQSRICNIETQMFCCKDRPQTIVKPVQKPYLQDEDSEIGNFLPESSKRTCGLEASQTSHFVINGNNTKPGQFPFMALLGVKVRKDIRGNGVTKIVAHWTCGGTLINHWYVLTAAHCQSNNNPLAYVRLGDWDVSTKDCVEDFCLPKPQTFVIKRNNFLIHKDYSKTKGNVVNDIALIRLPRPAKRNDGVQFACLPLTLPERDLGVADEEGVVIGWGHTNTVKALTHSGGDIVDHSIAKATQQSATLPIIGQDECDATWSLTNGVQSSQLCAGAGESDSCSGDSGGPLVMRAVAGNSEKVQPWIQAGIVSFGSKYCGSGRPGVYTRVEQYVSWIRGRLEE